MPRPRTPRPWRPRPTPEQRAAATAFQAEREALFAHVDAVRAWKTAVRARAWAIARTEGGLHCRHEMFETAEEALIAEGMVRPPPLGFTQADLLAINQRLEAQP